MVIKDLFLFLPKVKEADGIWYSTPWAGNFYDDWTGCHEPQNAL